MFEFLFNQKEIFDFPVYLEKVSYFYLAAYDNALTTLTSKTVKGYT